ncbi:MAG: hypothetical protein E6Q90_01180 [Actinobacteria bacterium]|nr:MAG: hypothetical protein E6Q90_01180 [Actinomycetota bacterium]
MSEVLNVALGLFGLFLLISTANSVIRTLVVPRVMSSTISNMVAVGTLGTVGFIARRMKSYRGRDRVQAWGGPLTILGLLIVWLGLFWLSYALMMQTLSGMSMATAFRESGSSLFTLGYATNERAQLIALDFFAAATGPITIGLMIGYLPTLYGSFSRREVEVTQLGWQAGEPNWGPELLARQATLGTLDELPDLWRAWTSWAADVSESHTTYSVLVAVRSTRSKRNWGLALLAVMDAAALQLSLMPQLPQARARMLLREGVQCLRALELIVGARTIAWTDDSQREGSHTEREVTLPRAEFDRGVARVRASGAPISVPEDEAWEVFRLWRARYEDWAYELLLRIDAVPAWWSGRRRPDTAPEPTPELGPIVATGPGDAGSAGPAEVHSGRPGRTRVRPLDGSADSSGAKSRPGGDGAVGSGHAGRAHRHSSEHSETEGSAGKRRREARRVRKERQRNLRESGEPQLDKDL